MRFSNILKKISIIIFINLLILLHLSWRIIFYPPVDLLNIVMLVFLGLIVYNPRERHLVAATYTLLICELFYTSSFGIESFSQISALLIANWLLLNIFTNRSLIIVFFTGFITMFIYRIIFIILTFFSSALQSHDTLVSLEMVRLFASEAIITAIALSIIYLISTIFIKRLHPEYILETSSLI